MLSAFLGGASADASMPQPSPRLAATTARRASANAAPAPSRSPGSPGVAAVWNGNHIMAEPCRRPALHSRVTCRLLMEPGEVPTAWPKVSGPKCSDTGAQAASSLIRIRRRARAASVAPNHSSISPTLAPLFLAVRLLELARPAPGRSDTGHGGKLLQAGLPACMGVSGA